MKPSGAFGMPGGFEVLLGFDEVSDKGRKVTARAKAFPGQGRWRAAGVTDESLRRRQGCTA